MKKIDALLTLLTCILTFAATGQSYIGVHSSNYAGVMGTDVQPASFVDSRFKFDLNLISADVTLWNNAKYFDTDDMPGWWRKSFRSDTAWKSPDSTFTDRYFRDSYKIGDNKSLGFYSNFQLDVLNFMFHINPRIAVGFSGKVRMINNVENVDGNFLKLVESDFDVATLWGSNFNEKLLTANSMAWAEYGFNYSQVLRDEGPHFMKAGGRFKLLQGIAATYLYTDNFNYELLNKDTATTLRGDFQYGNAGDLDELSDIRHGAFPKSASKMGIGLDLGFVYEWRPDWQRYKYEMDNVTNIWRRDENKYKLRAGVSILDIGGMKFTKNPMSRDFSVNTSTLDIRAFKSMTDLTRLNFQRLDTIIDSLSTAFPDEWKNRESAGETFYMNTPTSLSLQVDYHIWRFFYVNATGMINILSKKNTSKVHITNQVVITPSFDHAWFGIHVPLSYNQYSGFKAGFATRLGPLTIGVVDFNTLFAANRIKGAQLYAGVRVPILYDHPMDSDADKVSDGIDNCIDVPGVWAFRGCPDTDGDGIQDADDLCPEVPGIKEFKGCPDTDGDKIPDKDDACPELAGTRQHEGCPDTDGDGIIDPKDDCIDVPGIIAFNGCPDTDGDGIKDSEDACPDVAGPLENQGCPDTDNDGIFDFLDNCPTAYGPRENNGCPWPDTDKDGLLDKDDKCPNVAGPIKNLGCPYEDTDGDGINDLEDKCPTVKGTPANFGCPEIKIEEQEILKTAFENLEFNTGNAIIKQVSYESLDELAALLVKKPEWKLQISGHTDNVGNDQSNLVLSKKRAEAVKAYLVGKDVPAARLVPLFFGETQPISTNETEEGRQKNRRVEMTVIFQ